MFYIGKEYQSVDGQTHKVVMHNLHGKFPIITTNKKGKLHAFTRDGQFLIDKPSDKDLIK